MKKILFLSIALLSLTLYAGRAEAQMDPRVKTIAVMAGYGTVGGALLGLSSLAFRSSPRAIPVGASLGLYAGLLFGSYIIVTHEMRKGGYQSDDNYYPESPATPYDNGEKESTPYDGGGESEGAYWNPTVFQREYTWTAAAMRLPRTVEAAPKVFYLDLINYRF